MFSLVVTNVAVFLLIVVLIGALGVAGLERDMEGY